MLFTHATARPPTPPVAALSIIAPDSLAPHGGALANLVHCAPGTAVVEIVPAQTVRLFYAGLSYARGLHYSAFAAREFSYNGNVVVDAEALADVVRAAARGGEG